MTSFTNVNFKLLITAQAKLLSVLFFFLSLVQKAQTSAVVSMFCSTHVRSDSGRMVEASCSRLKTTNPSVRLTIRLQQVRPALAAQATGREDAWSPSPSMGGVLVPPQPRSSRYECVLVELPQPSLQEPGRGLWPVILTFLSLYKDLHAITGLVYVPAIMRASVRCTFTRKYIHFKLFLYGKDRKLLMWQRTHDTLTYWLYAVLDKYI